MQNIYNFGSWNFGSTVKVRNFVDKLSGNHSMASVVQCPHTQCKTATMDSYTGCGHGSGNEPRVRRLSNEKTDLSDRTRPIVNLCLNPHTCNVEGMEGMR